MRSTLPFRDGPSGWGGGRVFCFDSHAGCGHHRWSGFGLVFRLRLSGPGLGRVLPLGLLVLLVVIGLDDVLYDGARGFSAVLAAFLNEYRDDYLRIAPRCVANEPSVVEELLLFADAVACVVTNDLGGSGFAGELDVLQPEGGAGTTF